MKTETEKTPFEIWKELGINRCEAEFSCGGDSMNDMSFSYYNKENEKVEDANEKLDWYFEDEIYNNVDFYVNSDGHYMGESGIVYIELNDDDEDDLCFGYDKSSKSEWYEHYSTKLEVKVDEELFDFIIKNVRSMEGGNNDEVVVNYKEDCIIEDVIQEKFDAFVKELVELCYDCEFECFGEPSDDFRYELEDWELVEDKEKNTLYFVVSQGFYEYKDEE